MKNIRKNIRKNIPNRIKELSAAAVLPVGVAPVPAVARAAMNKPAPRPKPNFLAIDRDPAHLHPVMRDAVAEVLRMCEAEKLPFRLFEGFRYARRQSDLYLEGRVPHKPGPILTNDPPWSSLHNYGLAADFGLFLEGQWVWADNALYSHLWVRLPEIGAFYGLEGSETEKPHLQIATLELRDLQAGRYPGGGDASWQDALDVSLEDCPMGPVE